MLLHPSSSIGPAPPSLCLDTFFFFKLPLDGAYKYGTLTAYFAIKFAFLTGILKQIYCLETCC